MQKDGSEPEVRLLEGQDLSPEERREAEQLMKTAFVPVWFPHKNQLVPMRNPNWFHSAWIGLYWTIIHAPEMIIALIFIPLARAIWRVLNVLVMTPILGFAGRLSSMNLQPHMVAMVQQRDKDE